MIPSKISNPFETQQVIKRRRSHLVHKRRALEGRKQSKSSIVSKATRCIPLLLDLQHEKKCGSFVDDRLQLAPGQSGNLIKASTPVLRTSTTKRSRKASRQAFNLSDDACTSNLILTHRGTAVSELTDSELRRADDVDSSDEAHDDDRHGFLPALPHFGGGSSETKDNSTATRPKTGKEIYDEIIRKSKQAKAERLIQKEQQEECLEELNKKFDLVKQILDFKNRNESSQVHQDRLNPLPSQDDQEYNGLLKELAFKPRCQPTDRIKTAAEIAADRVATFQRLEQERLNTNHPTAMLTPESSEDEATSAIETDVDEPLSPQEALHNSPALSSGKKNTTRAALVRPVTTGQVHWLQQTQHDKEIKDLVKSYVESMDSKNDMDTYKTLYEDVDGVQRYTKNDSALGEEDLPFHIHFPGTYEAFEKLVSGYIPSAQLKLLCRMQTLWDPCLDPTYHTHLETLLKFLLMYLFNRVTQQCSAGLDATISLFIQSTQKKILPESVHLDAVALLFTLKSFVGNLSNKYPSVFMEFFTLRLIKVSMIICPGLHHSLKTLVAFESYKPLLEKIQIDDNNTVLLPETLALLHMIFTFYPEAERNHPLVTPSLMILDALGLHASGMTQYNYQTISQPFRVGGDGKSPMSETTSIQLDEAGNGVLHLAQGYPLGPCIILLGLAFQYVLSTSRRYLPCLIPLACAILPPMALDGQKRNQTVVRLICHNLSTVLRDLFMASKKASMDLFSARMILPTTTFILQSQPELEPVVSLHALAQHYTTTPIYPVHLGPVEPEGIKMLKPQYVDGTSPSGARYLRFHGATEDMIRSKKLKRCVKNERRGASRQLRRDAEVLSSIRAREKNRKNALLQQNYKKLISTLEKDAQDLHQMRTSVLPQGREPYRSKKTNKNKKKKN